MKIYFATSNPVKFAEAKPHFDLAGLELEHHDTELVEMQTDDIEDLALDCVSQAYEEVEQPVFVEDAGMFIRALKDFPGVYSKQAYYTLGLDGILKLMEGVEDRYAEFRAVIAYTDGDEEKVFKGVCKGNIASQVRGRDGFGFDPIFLPEGKNKTFAEDVEAKSNLSHRALAMKQLVEYLKTKN
ncbi:MAG: XTP/dITP diphosphatase [archaeon]